MTESQLNHMIDESFKQHGYSYKIPDAPRKNAASRPFDGFAVIPEGNIFWETKLIKAYRAFPFSMILQHQIDALTEIDAVEAYNETIPLIILGIYISNARADLFFFDIDYILKSKEAGAGAMSKEDLEIYKARDRFLPLEKGRFDVTKIPSKIIYWI